MAVTPLSKDDAINIIGAGIFGLSTAIHLAERGYRRVTVFDKQPYDETLYSYFKGADAASADINKIVRSAYGGERIYQDLTLEAIERWKAWNKELADGDDVPDGMTKKDQVFVNNGNLIMTDGRQLPPFEQATVDSMIQAGYPDTQLITSDSRHRRIAQERGVGYAIDPFRREARGKPNVAVLDTTGGTAIANKACRFALHKARRLGVNFVLGPQVGELASLCYDSMQTSKVIGHKTRDGKQHTAAMTVLACGGWTPSLLPALDDICETTAGSVALIKIPQESELWSRFAPENFPTWVYKMRDGAEGGLYGFPRNEQGWLKIGYRGTKYTNPVAQPDGKERSVPVTRWSSPISQRLAAIPKQALDVIESFIAEHLPELAAEGLGVTKTRLCWYNDSFDNHLLIDRVPDCEGLVVCTAGSGHAFKYLPVIGKYVVDVIEGEQASFQAWRWRRLEKGETPVNVLMQGSNSMRALANVQVVSDVQLKHGIPTSKL